MKPDDIKINLIENLLMHFCLSDKSNDSLKMVT